VPFAFVFSGFVFDIFYSVVFALCVRKIVAPRRKHAQISVVFKFAFACNDGIDGVI
jgi:hypothetical protein